MKNKIIIVIILFISACSSVPKIEKSESINTLIQKPEFNYKIKSLPKSVKIYFDLRDDKSNLPPEVQGFIACLLYTSPSPRDYAASRMPSSA